MTARAQKMPAARQVLDKAMRESEGERTLETHLREHGVEFVREFRFAPSRNYRADFLVGLMLLVEVEGGAFSQASRHRTGTGFTKDCEKASIAAVNGYRVIRCTTEQVLSAECIGWISEALGVEKRTEPATQFPVRQGVYAMSKDHAAGYRVGWLQATETILRAVEDLPSERLEGGGSIAPDAFDKWVEVVGRESVLAVIADAIMDSVYPMPPGETNEAASQRPHDPTDEAGGGVLDTIAHDVRAVEGRPS